MLFALLVAVQFLVEKLELLVLDLEVFVELVRVVFEVRTHLDQIGGADFEFEVQSVVFLRVQIAVGLQLVYSEEPVVAPTDRVFEI